MNCDYAIQIIKQWSTLTWDVKISMTFLNDQSHHRHTEKGGVEWLHFRRPLHDAKCLLLGSCAWDGSIWPSWNLGWTAMTFVFFGAVYWDKRRRYALGHLRTILDHIWSPGRWSMGCGAGPRRACHTFWASRIPPGLTTASLASRLLGDFWMVHGWNMLERSW